MRGLLTLGVALLLMPAVASAQNIQGSDHDLSGLGGQSEICVFCHTPHNASIAVPLWNHATDNTGYTMYTSTTLDGATNPAPEGVSLQCMGCHDGVTNIDAYGGAGGTVTIGDGDHLVGRDLSNDHPISIEYDNVADPGLNPPAGSSVGGLPLYAGTQGDQVECGSCHNPHDDDSFGDFLRASNAASALCLTCHNM